MALWDLLKGRPHSLRSQVGGKFLKLLIHHSTHSSGEGQTAPHKETHILRERKWMLDGQKIAGAKDSEHMHAYTIISRYFYRFQIHQFSVFILLNLKGLD